MEWLLNEESGQGMVEYGLILVLVSVVAIVALGGLGKKLGPIFDDVTKSLTPSSGGK